MVTRNQVVDLLKSQIGTYGPPNNRNKFNRWYYGRDVSGDAYAWCVVFKCWGMDQLGILSANGGKFAGVEAFRAHFTAVGAYVGNPTNTAKFEPGDHIAYDLNGNGSGDHFGTVVKVLTATTFQAVEGNTSGKGNDDVALKTRSVHEVIGHAKLLGVSDDTSGEDDMGDYVSIDKATTGAKPSRIEVLNPGEWTQIYFNRNGSAAAAKHHSNGDYPSFVQGGHYYNGNIRLQIAGLPLSVPGQIRVLYTDAKTNAPKMRDPLPTEFVGSDGDTFVTLPADGFVPTGQKCRVEVVHFGPATVQARVIAGRVRLFVK